MLPLLLHYCSCPGWPIGLLPRAYSPAKQLSESTIPSSSTTGISGTETISKVKSSKEVQNLQKLVCEATKPRWRMRSGKAGTRTSSMSQADGLSIPATLGSPSCMHDSIILATKSVTSIYGTRAESPTQNGRVLHPRSQGRTTDAK